MPIRKIIGDKNNNIAKKEQIRLKKELNRLIYITNTAKFIIYVTCKKSFHIRL